MRHSKKGLDIVTESHIAATENAMDIKNIMSQEDYLESIYTLSKENKYIKSVDLAKAMNVSRPAVKAATEKLIEKGYIKKDRYSQIEITEEGKIVGEEIFKKHIVLLDFLMNIGVSREIALLDCCRIEHMISKETYEKIKDFNKKFDK